MISEKFYGSFNELRKTIELSGLKGKWSREAEKEVFRVQGHKRGVINWYPTTNTLFFQGKYEVVAYNYRHFRAALINSLRQ